jgi:hypothetical protein
VSPANPNSYEAHEPSILLVRDDAVLPPALSTEGQSSFLPGWRAIKNFDEYALRRKIRETNWSFLHLRGGKETGVMMGRARDKVLQKAVAHLLAELRGRKFNSLEVTVLLSKCFLGLRFLRISVNLRHFQHNVPSAS